MSRIQFFTEDVQFRLPGKGKIRTWINSVLASEGFRTGCINFIFVSDDYLLKLNIKHLNHNTLTDILTFSGESGSDKISGDIFISVERVNENAVKYNVTVVNEMLRVLIHGVLHLMGYKDKSGSEKALMREKEELCLELYAVMA